MGRAEVTPNTNPFGMGDLAARAAKAAQVRNPNCDPSNHYVAVTDILCAIRQHRNKPLFALIADFIDDEILRHVYSWRREFRESAQGDSFDVPIHSPGGQLTNCYMIARLLGRFAGQWEALVPEVASSGATMICLGSSSIVMSEIAQLGPLDPQVVSKKQEKFFASERQSPLEAFEALRYLREFAAASLDALMEVLIERGIAPQKALETSVAIATDLTKPVLEQIDPYDLGAFSLDNRLALNYCKEIARPSIPGKKTQRRAYYKSLVEEYPAHEFAIDITEAQAIKFIVSQATDEVEDLFDRFRSCVTPIKSYIGFVPLPKKEESNEPIISGPNAE